MNLLGSRVSEWRSARVWRRRVEHTLRAHGEEECLGVGPRLFPNLVQRRRPNLVQRPRYGV